jgi:acyl-CoA synthetase (AMP-forming)/AMP-acid ligase II
MQNSSVVSLLRERAGLQPDDLAFRYTDYEQDGAGATETLSWAQPTTTSGKIRRAACVEESRQRQFTRLDA